MFQLVKKVFGGLKIFGAPIQSRADRLKLLLEDPDIHDLIMMAYNEGRDDVLLWSTHKTKESLIELLKSVI
jgi:hypothetical protein